MSLFRRTRPPAAKVTHGDIRELYALLTSVRSDKQLLEEVVERMNEGVLILSEALIPKFVNAAARRMLGLPQVSLPSRVAPEEILSVGRRCLYEGQVAEEIVHIRSGGQAMSTAVSAWLLGQDGVIVFLRDVTEELRTQRMRRQFVAHASHELKTPVASVLALAEAIHEAARDDPDAAAWLSERMVKEADRLGRLVVDLLDLSKVEDPSSISLSRVSLSEITSAEAARAAPEAERKGIALIPRIEQSITVRGDAEQLALMVRNLLDNAVRYTDELGEVSLALFRDGGEVVVQIRDNGIGIPLRARSRVFERFFRVDDGRSRDRGGTGLGLAIVKHVVDLHGGLVELDTELGEGSTFTVRLPAPPPFEDL
jgi:signal transduction histidine kinase